MSTPLALQAPSLQLQIINELVLGIELGQIAMLMDAGIPAALLDDLRELKHADIARLVTKPLGFSLAIDATQLQHQLQTLKAQVSQRLLLEYFVQHKAPVTLIQQLFKISRSDITALRKAMGAAEDNLYLSIGERVRTDIEAKWLSVRGDFVANAQSPTQLALGWQTLHKCFETHSLATLYSVVQSFERMGRSNAACTHMEVGQ